MSPRPECVLGRKRPKKVKKEKNVTHCACAPGEAGGVATVVWRRDQQDRRRSYRFVGVARKAALLYHGNEGAWPIAAL